MAKVLEARQALAALVAAAAAIVAAAT